MQSTMLAFADLRALALNRDEVRARIELAAVIAHYGDTPDENGRALCPFHADTNPSLTIWTGDDGVQRFSCFPCGLTGDVFDFIGRMEDVDLSGALVVAAETFAGDEPVTVPQRRQREVVDFTAEAEDALGSLDFALIAGFLSDSGIPVPAEWIVETFGVGTDPWLGEVLIPHWREDRTACAIKRRLKGGTKWQKQNVKGSTLDVLYGAWRDEGRATVVVVEGESDTWTASYVLRDDPVDVVGLPAGARTFRPEWVERFAGRHVVLMLDPDPAGREGAVEIAQKLDGVAASVSTVDLHPTKPGRPRDLAADVSEFVWLDGDLRSLLFPQDDAGHDVENAHADDLRVYSPREMLELAREPIEWQVRGLLVRQTFGPVAGPKKTMKSNLCGNLSIAVAAGRSVFGKFAVDAPQRVLYFVGEGGTRPFSRVLWRHAKAYGLSLNPPV